MQAEFGVSVGAANTSVTAPLLVFACGVLLWGPISDRLGRRPVILVGLAIAAVGSLIALFAPSLPWLTAGRVVQAAGTSAGLTVARAMIGDLYRGEAMARMIAYLTMAMVVANSVAPIVGGLLGDVAPWRSVFALMLAMSIATALPAWFRLRETRDAAAAHEGHVLEASFALVTRPAFLAFMLQGAFVYSTFVVFIALMPYVFVHGLGHGAREYGLWYLWLAAGYFVGNWHVARYAVRVGANRMLIVGLVLKVLGAAIALVLALAGVWHAAAIFLPWALIAYGQGLALPNITAKAVALSPRHPGAASGLLGFGQQIAGAAAVQAMSLATTGTPVPVAAFVAAAACGGVLALAFTGPHRAPGAAAH